MAVITISGPADGLGHEIASKTCQRLSFILVDSALISDKLGLSRISDAERFAELVLRREISSNPIKKLVIEQALESNVVVYNLGAEVLFRDFPGILHIKVLASNNKMPSRKLIRDKERSYMKFVEELYGKQNLGNDFYDLQVKANSKDSDLAVELIVKAAEVKGITAKAGVTWKALKKLRASLEKPNSIPTLNQESKQIAMPSFAHPSEKDFASVLDFYRIRWEYEPRTFLIEADSDGKVKEEFTPDFYLPDLNLYIELTTLKQKLVTKKNRKIRRLKELYPDINIKIFYGKDYRRLLHRFGIK